MQKTANIFGLVDFQNGFLYELPLEKGGNLCVPRGEATINAVTEFINWIKQDSCNVVLCSQEMHPKYHRSFAAVHELEPFTPVHLKIINGKAEIVPEGTIGSFPQTLWTIHCVEDTESCKLAQKVSLALPPDFREMTENDEKSKSLIKESDNEAMFVMVRKGTDKNLHGYGIVMENDGKTKNAAAFEAFEKIINKLKKDGTTDVNICIGGLAGNYCVEITHDEIWTYFVPMLKANSITPTVYALTDTYANIPIETKDGAWPDSANTEKRFESFGTIITTSKEFMGNYKLEVRNEKLGKKIIS